MKYLRLCNYFRNVTLRFIKLTAAPLDALRNYKSVDGLWTVTHTKDFFESLLQAALSYPAVALSLVDFCFFRLHVATDASASYCHWWYHLLYYQIKRSVVHYVVMTSRKRSLFSEMSYFTTRRDEVWLISTCRSNITSSCLVLSLCCTRIIAHCFGSKLKRRPK